jgi:electron transfer flavoprotein alpha subunit
MAVLLIAEHDNTSLNGVTHKAMTAASAIGSPVHVLVAGKGCTAAAAAAAKIAGVEKVLVADDAAYANLLAEPTAALIAGLAPGYAAIVAPSTANTKNVMPRVAALIDVQQISDIIKVISADTFERPIYAGNAVQTVQSSDKVKVITVRTASFAAVAEGGSAKMEAVASAGNAGLSTFVGQEIVKSDRPELSAAKIVVSGGRALASSENFKKVIEPLADIFGAAVGASRAAVDAGYAPNDWQVGQTGKVVAPELYVAVGISGAIQHLAGMKDSKVIVAINKDEEAPIFQVADFGLVGDLFALVPELQAELAKGK